MVHVIGDFIQSLGVLIAAIILYYTNWVIIDPICTFLFSVLVIFTTIPIAKDCINVMTNSTPWGFDWDLYVEKLKEIKEVKEVW